MESSWGDVPHDQIVGSFPIRDPRAWRVSGRPAEMFMDMVSPLLIGTALDRISILSFAFRATIALLGFAALTAAVLLVRRRRWWAAVPVTLAVVLLGANVAAAVNAHYGYYPNVASLLGNYRGADQTSWSDAQAARALAPDRSTEPAMTGRSRLRASHLGSSNSVPAPTPATPIEHGKLVQVDIAGTTSGFAARPAEVYLPPAWTQNRELRLPVVVMLHGTPGSPEDWARSARADEVSDRWATRHGGVAPILVMPDVNGRFWKDTECTDGTEGNADTYLSVDVPRWIRSNLHPALDRGQWGIGGLSEGGLCAVDLALRHPAVYSTFLDYSGDAHVTHHGGPLSLFTGSPSRRRADLLAYDPEFLLRHFPNPGQVSGWFEVGAKDRGTVAQEHRLYLIARARGFDVQFRIRPRVSHTFHAWTLSFVDSYPWMIQHLVATPFRAVPPAGSDTASLVPHHRHHRRPLPPRQRSGPKLQDRRLQPR